jgi:subfamily B ATP-binding cassette protein MsbA
MIAKNIFGYVQTYFTEYLEQRVLYHIRRDVYAHILDLPLSYFDRERAGHLISKVTNDVSMLRGAVIGVFGSVLRNLLMTLLALAILLSVSWRLTLLVLCIVPLNVLLIDWVGRKLKRRSRRAQEGMADMTASLEETIAGVRVVKAFDTRSREQERFGRHSYRHMMHYVKMQMYGALSAPTSELLGTVSFAIVLWYGGQRVIDGGLPAENLVMFVAAMLFVVSPLKNLESPVHVVQHTASAQRACSICSTGARARREGTRTASFERGTLRERVRSIRGRRGRAARKSPSRPGRVKWWRSWASGGRQDDARRSDSAFLHPRRSHHARRRRHAECSLSSLRALTGIVTQETILFNDSIYNNIAYGSPQATADAVERAARAANAHDFIVGFRTVTDDPGGRPGCPTFGRAAPAPPRAPSCATPPSLSSTKPPAPSIAEVSAWCRKRWNAFSRAAPPSSSRTVYRPFATPTRSSCWNTGA